MNHEIHDFIGDFHFIFRDVYIFLFFFEIRIFAKSSGRLNKRYKQKRVDNILFRTKSILDFQREVCKVHSLMEG